MHKKLHLLPFSYDILVTVTSHLQWNLLLAIYLKWEEVIVSLVMPSTVISIMKCLKWSSVQCVAVAVSGAGVYRKLCSCSICI